MFKKIFFATAVIATLVSCTNIEARRPISQSTGTQISTSVERNKQRIEQEEKVIQQYMDSLGGTFETSANGFYYRWDEKDPIEGNQPGFGDEVTFTYNLSALDGTVIYSTEQISPRTYAMDKQKIFTGMRQALKLMQVGETATFLFPSYTAFGYYGDTDRIGSNQILMSTVTIMNIKINKQ